MVHMYAGHDRIHEQQIERLRDALVAAKKSAKEARRREARESKQKRKGRKK
jgi:hypothetical protein